MKHQQFLKLMEVGVSSHKRSNSDPVTGKQKKYAEHNILEAPHCTKLRQKMEQLEECGQLKQRKSPKADTLKKEIFELQMRLQNQFTVRHELEKALMSNRPFCCIGVNDKSIPMPAKELIQDIAMLELEVVYLEQYVLSLYRKMFGQRAPPQSKMDDKCIVGFATNKAMQADVTGPETISHEQLVADTSNNATSHKSSKISIPKEYNKGHEEQVELLDSGVDRCHSSITQQSLAFTPTAMIERAEDSYHSLPLSMLEQAQNDNSGVIGVGVPAYTELLQTPNRLSEEIIKSISCIYCHLADPPFRTLDYTFSPVSLSSSQSEIVSQGQEDACSPHYGNFTSSNSSLENPLHIGDPTEFAGPYCAMRKVLGISRGSKKLSEIHHELQSFKLLVSQLEVVNPAQMKHEEKLAFWINIHNALVMHAFLVNGIPRNNAKRISLSLKAAYNVGGQTINIDMIQSSILNCQLLRPRNWLQMLFSSRMKLKVGDARKAYAIDHPEPRLYFALCSGSYSDPAVRVYTPKRVFEDLENAKEDYIQSNFLVHKETKLLLPKIVESFAKEQDFCIAGLLEMIEHLLPDSVRKTIQLSHHRKFSKNIEWIPHNFAFRYLFPKELA